MFEKKFRDTPQTEWESSIFENQKNIFIEVERQ